MGGNHANTIVLNSFAFGTAFIELFTPSFLLAREVWDLMVGIPEIGSAALSEITGLDLSGADGLAHIGFQAFNDFAGLVGTVRVPATVTEIGKWAFEDSGITGFVAATDAVAELFRDCDVSVASIMLSGGSPSLSPVTEFTDGDLKYRVTGADTVSIIRQLGMTYGAVASPATVKLKSTVFAFPPDCGNQCGQKRLPSGAGNLSPAPDGRRFLE